MKQRTDFYEFIENIYSNSGKEKKYEQQITEGYNNINSVCSRTRRNNEKTLFGEQA